MPPSASLELPATRTVALPERRRRRLLARPRPVREWTWIVQLWLALALPITAVLYAVDIPGGLELHGWIAAAFVYLPGPVFATAIASVRAIGMLNPQTRALAQRIESVRRGAARALEQEMRALAGDPVYIEEHELDVRQAWCLHPGEEGGSVTWVLAGDTHALVIGGELPSTRLSARDPTVPRRWVVERLPRTRRLLNLRTRGAAVQLKHGEAHTGIAEGDCDLYAIERLPLAIAEASVGLGGPYRG